MAETDKKVAVDLAGKPYWVKRVPMARIKRLVPIVEDALKDVDLGQIQGNPSSTVSLLVDKALEFPHAVLSLFIDDLPKEIFTDEENGVDLPDFMAALKVALDLNRVDSLKNAFSRLAVTMTGTQAQASTLRKTSW